MKSIHHISNRLVLKNSLLNFFSQGVVVVLAFFCLPIIVRHLSSEHFGLLTFVWAVVGYFTMFDFGISRAITKFLSEYKLSENAEITNGLVWTALLMGGVIGIGGGIILYAGSVYLIRFLSVTSGLSEQAMSLFRLAALAVPAMVLLGIVRGIQSAYHRFDLVNMYQFLLGSLQWIGSAALLVCGYGLYEIVVLIVVGRIVLTLISIIQLPTIIEDFSFKELRCDRSYIRKIFSFGGWITISQSVGPLCLYADRFFIGSFLSLTAVGYYVLPNEMLSRILIIPLSLVSAMFPAMSEIQGKDPSSEFLANLYVKAMKYLAYILFPMTMVLIAFSKEILTLWVGSHIADQSFLVFSIMAFGLLFNSLTQVPSTLLHAVNRPKVTALANVAELPLLVGLNVVLIPMFGIAGAAVSWVLRVLFDFAVLQYFANKSVKIFKLGIISKSHAAAAFILSGGCAISFAMLSVSSLSIKAIYLSAIIIVYPVFLFRQVLTNADKTFLRTLLSSK